MTSVKVAVRVRPLNSREDGLDSSVIIQMDGCRTKISNPKVSDGGEGDSGRENLKNREFSYDFSFWSVDNMDKHYATQTQVFKSLGEDVVQAAFDGYNVCIFAYGQTGSGKTYTMMGSKEDPGLIPRYCDALFHRMNDKGSSYDVSVSYLEIYNEKVRDLLSIAHPSNSPRSPGTPTHHNLRVREHPRDGPYVQDLAKHIVTNYGALADLMHRGNVNRTTASTNMNDVSSRSHAIFTITFTQARFMNGLPSERQSKINLVDLAGSERADASGATGLRLKEGGSINRSLVSLGNVISLLAEKCEQGKKGKVHIPYRDSVLTWLLKDSLGGNAKTVMIATVSPADVNYGETLSTLRYANRAKNIINRPTVNEDPNVKLIRELREEIARLKSLLEGAPDISPRDKEKLHEKEARIKVLTEQWAGKWKEGEENVLGDKNLALRQEGQGVILDSTLPHLIGIDDDVLSTGIKLYHLKEGIIKIGAKESEESQDINITGPDVEPEHCVIEHRDGCVYLHPIEESMCTVNGHTVTDPTQLTQGTLITLGRTNMFRFNHPEQARQMKEMQNHVRKSASVLSLRSGPIPTQTSLLSQSMSDLYRSNDSLALQGSAWDVSVSGTVAYREDQEEIEHLRQEIMQLEDQYSQAEAERREREKAIEEEVEEKNERLAYLMVEIDALKSQNSPYDNLVQGLRQCDDQEGQLRGELRMSRERLGKEIESITYPPDQLSQEETVTRVLADLDLHITGMERQIDDFNGASDRQKKALSREEKELLEKQSQLERDLEGQRSDYEEEKTQLLTHNEALLLEVQDLDMREADMEEGHTALGEEKQAAWQETLQTLQEHQAEIEEAWRDLEDNEAEVKAKLKNRRFISAAEKLSYEQEAAQLGEARRLLEGEESNFAEYQRTEMGRVEEEVEEWEGQKAEELSGIESARRNLLFQHSASLQRLDEEMAQTQDRERDVREDLEQVQSSMLKVSEDMDKELESLQQELEARTEERREVERKNEEKRLQRREKIDELGSELDSLEHTFSVRLEGVHTERLRLVGLQEEILRKSSINPSEPLDLETAQVLKEERIRTEGRQQDLDVLRSELEAATFDLEVQQRSVGEERESQLDKLEWEKLKLLDMERQDRVNNLVEQEVKCRLFEEKLERERQRKAERQRERGERDREIVRLKSLHQRELNMLKARLEGGGKDSETSNESEKGQRAEGSETKSQTSSVSTVDPSRKSVVKQLSYTEPQSYFNIEVPSFVMRGAGSDMHYEYLVKVSIQAESWCIFRRYSRFRDLHVALKRQYPAVNQLVFPPKVLFHKNTKVAMERRQLLEDYIRHLVEMCMRLPECPLHPSNTSPVTKQALVAFDPFFKRGLFETTRNMTS